MTAHVTSAAITNIRIETVMIGPRRRQKLGNIRQLAASIQQHGLIHPIVVRNDCELVSGQRRLEACRQLGWKTIPARSIETLSDDELRAIELDENTQRLAFNDFETSKARLAQIRQAQADLKTREESSRVSRKGKRGPERKPGSRKDVADAIGISAPDQRAIEQHVELAEQYPFMQRDGWRQYHVLQAGEALEQIPDAERPKVAALLDQDAIPPQKAIGVLKNVATLPRAERKEIFQLAESPDVHDRRTALTKAAALPPPVDPGLTLLDDAAAALKKAARSCRAERFKPRILELATEVIALIDEFNTFVKGSAA